MGFFCLVIDCRKGEIDDGGLKLVSSEPFLSRISLRVIIVNKFYHPLDGIIFSCFALVKDLCKIIENYRASFWDLTAWEKSPDESKKKGP